VAEVRVVGVVGCDGVEGYGREDRKVRGFFLGPPFEEGGEVEGEGPAEDLVVVNVRFGDGHSGHVAVQHRSQLLIGAAQGVQEGLRGEKVEINYDGEDELVLR